MAKNLRRKKSPNSRKQYAINDCPFYRLGRKDKLAELLNINSTQKLISLAKKADELYFEYDKYDPKRGKSRHIEEPKRKLKYIHWRIQDLLGRIILPEFIYSPGRGKSYIDNARVHINSPILKKIDIKKYYPSTTSNRVSWFFHNRMECTQDVAKILTNLSTFKGHLPTGSPSSPILAYYAHADMWETLGKLATENNCLLTVWVDDITISGTHIPSAMIWEMKKAIARNGLQYHKEEFYSGNKPREVTGAILVNGQLKAPHRHHLKLHHLKNRVSKETNELAIISLLHQLHSAQSQIDAIEHSSSSIPRH